MILRSVWLASGLLLAAVVLVVVALFYGVNLRFATGFLEQQLSGRLDREVSLKAPRLRIRNSIEFSLGQVTISDPDAELGPRLLELDSASIRLDSRSVLTNTIVVEDLQVHGLRVNVVRDRDGKLNLPAGLASDPSDGVTESPVAFVVARASISDTRIERFDLLTGKSTVFEIDALTQQAIADERVEIRGTGAFQSRPWTLAIDGNRLSNLLAGENLEGQFAGSLGDIQLDGSFELPKIHEPKDLRLDATLNGPVPPRIAELSPLLEPHDNMHVDLNITDIDPGISVDLQVTLSHLSLSLTGAIDQPGVGDGLALALELDSTSLPALADALGMGQTEEIPIQASAKLSRRGRTVVLRDLEIKAEQHLIQGTAHIPALPSTDGAQLEVNATGPDFGLYQRLLDRPLSIDAPYQIVAIIQTNSDGAEIVDSTWNIGESVVEIKGALGEFPSYRGSELNINLTGPSAKTIGTLINTPLPDSPYDASAHVKVSDDAQVEIDALTLNAFDARAELHGSFLSYPDLDEVNLELALNAPSLAATMEHFDIAGLAPSPASLTIHASGSMNNLQIAEVELLTAGLELSRDSGALRVRHGELTTDMQLSASIADIRALLANYAPEAYSADSVPAAPLSLTLKPELTDDLLRLHVKNLQTQGISGYANFEIGREFTIDERTRLETDIMITDLSLVPERPSSYQLPTGGLRLKAETLDKNGSRAIEAAILHRDRPMLSLTLEQNSAQEGPVLELKGAGQDIRDLGAFSNLPETDLPYRVDASAKFNNGRILLHARNISVAGSEMRGQINYDSNRHSLIADINIPKGDLRPWLKSRQLSASAEQDQPANDDDRVIPATEIPTAWLESFSTQISLYTGQVFVPDPLVTERSVIESSSMSLTSGMGKAELRIEQLEGSRGKLSGKVQLETTENTTDFSAEFSVSEAPFGITSVGSSLATLPKHQIDTHFTASGSTVRELAATLNGDFLLSGGAGSLKDMSLSFATESFVSQLFSTLLPMLKTDSPDMRVDCSVLAARAENGVIALDPGFVFRTNRVDLSARGEIDLRRERLSVRFDNQARKGLGISAASLVNPYVQITGSLAKPSLGIDVTSSAIAGGAAVATGGLTVLAKPLYGRFLKRGNPCETALERWAEASHPPASASN